MSTEDNNKEQHPFELRKPGERPVEHRALLLYAMQDEAKRSCRATARAMSRGDKTIRRWRTKHDWDDRIDAAGLTCCLDAIRRYRSKYFHRYGPRELRCIERNMATPVFEDEEQAIDGEGPATKHAVQRSLESEDVRLQDRRHMAALDMAIAKVVRNIQDGGVKLSARDLPVYMKLRQAIADRLAPAPVAQPGGKLVESTRVRMARQDGTSLVEAWHEDALELVAITSALRASEEAGADVVEFPGEREQEVG